MSRSVFALALLVASLHTAPAPTGATPGSPVDLKLAWAHLAGSDGDKAYRAVWAFVEARERAVTFLQGRLQPVNSVPAEVIAKLIAQLDNKAFADREKAQNELQRLAELAEPELRKANGKPLTLETKRRVEQLLARLREPGRVPEWVRGFRAVEALEQIGTDSACQLLRRLTGGAAESRLTQDALGSLARLAKRRRPVVAAAPLPKSDHFGDALPAGAVGRLGTVRFRDARCAALLPDGKTLAACQHGLLHLYDLASGKERPGFPKPAGYGPWECLTVSADGRFVAANWVNGKEVTVWELPSGKRLHAFHVAGSYSVPGHGMAFSLDGKVLYAADEATVHAWDMASGKELLALEHRKFPAPSARTVLSPGARYLATLPLRAEGREELMAIWDVATGKRLHRLEGAGALSAIFSSDGKTLATSGLQDRTVRLWEVATGKLRRTLRVPGGPPRSVPQGSAVLWSNGGARFVALAFSPGDKQLAFGDAEGGAIHVWNLESRADRPRVFAMPDVEWLQFTRDGTTLACRCFGQSVSLLDLRSGKEINPLDAHRGAAWSVAYSPDGTLLATSSADRTVRLWDAATGKPLRKLAGHSSWVFTVVFSRDGKCLAGGSEGEALVWDVTSGTKKWAVGHSGSVRHLAFSPDSRSLATQGSDGFVRLWNVANGEPARAIESSGDLPWGLAFSPDGKFLADVGHNSLRLRDVATGAVIRTFKTDVGASSAAFSPDGRTLAVAYLDKTILWEVLTGAERARLGGSNYTASGLAFSPDGRLLAAATDAHYSNTTHRVWDLTSGKERAAFCGHRNHVSALAFSPDGRRLATASADTTVLLWDLTGRTKK